MTPADLAKIAKPWVKVLGLSDWDIEWRYGGPGRDAHARANIEPGARKAIIRLYGDWDRGGNDTMFHDLELIVLHELVHCTLQTIEEIALSDQPKLVEHLCWMMAKMLLEAKK